MSAFWLQIDGLKKALLEALYTPYASTDRLLIFFICTKWFSIIVRYDLIMMTFAKKNYNTNNHHSRTFRTTIIKTKLRNGNKGRTYKNRTTHKINQSCNNIFFIHISCCCSKFLYINCSLMDSTTGMRYFKFDE